MKEPRELAIQNGDDSSDEEELNKKYQNSSAASIFTQFINSQQTDAPKTDAPTKLAFMAHLLGVRLLYSPAINKIHFANKPRLLGKSYLLSSQEQIKNLIEESLLKPVKAILGLLTEEFIQQYTIVWTNTVNTLAADIDSLIKFKDSDYQKSQFHKNHAKSLEGIYYSMQGFLSSKNLSSSSSFELHSFSVADLAAEKSVQSYLFQEIILPLLKKQLQEWQLWEHDNQTPSKTAIPRLFDKIPYETSSAIEKKALDLIKKIPRKTMVENVLIPLKVESVEIKIAELLQAEANQPSAWIIESKTYNLRSDENRLKRYEIVKAPPGPIDPVLHQVLTRANQNSPQIFRPTLHRVKHSDILSNLTINYSVEKFSQEFYAEVSKRKATLKWNRSFLSTQYTLSVKNSQESIAGIRLFNSSQKRKSRQREQDSNYGWKEVSSRSWLFNFNYASLEQQELTANDNGRNDKVVSLSNYENIYAQLCDLLILTNNYLKSIRKPKIQDREIAQAIRNILNGAGQPLRYADGEVVLLDKGVEKPFFTFLANFTYLLFETEPTRMPLSLITNAMMLDLIIESNGEINWKDAIASDNNTDGYKGGLIPMSIGGKNQNEKKGEVVRTARSIIKKFKDFLPYHYKYPGEPLSESDITKETTLKKRIAFIMTLWLSKHSDNIAANIDIKQRTDEIYESKLLLALEIIENQIKTWYPTTSVANKKFTSQTHSYSGNFFYTNTTQENPIDESKENISPTQRR